MTQTIVVAPVHKTITVDADPEFAFEVFTSGVDRWWPKSHSMSDVPVKEVIIEPYVGGRYYVTGVDGSEAITGHVRVWEPGRRLVFSWEISAQWKPDPRLEFASEVEVLFIAAGPNQTRVELNHYDFERMGEADGTTMRNAVDGGWPSILQLFATEVAKSATR